MTTSRWIECPVEHKGRARRSSLALALLSAVACAKPSESAPSKPAEPASVTLRFAPSDREAYREHWIYDIELPGSAMLRTGLSFDVSVSKLDPSGSGVRLRHVLRRHYRARDGAAEAVPRTAGTVMHSHWGGDRALGEVTFDAGNPQLTAAARNAIESARFGLLIEYPEQAVGIGDSWSIEPRRLAVGPALEATLRPSYTLEAIEKSGDAREAVIAADIQLDLEATKVSDAVSIEGGGTASGTLRVRVRDGLLLDARTALHFNQEIRVQGSEVLGYREFSARSHVFTTGLSAQPNLSAEPLKLEGADPDEQRECAALLASVTDRVGRAPAQSRLYLVGALHADALPSAHDGTALHEAGASLVVTAEPKHVEFDGAMIETKELAVVLRKDDKLVEPVYVYAEANQSVDRLRTVLAALPREAIARLVVRDADDPAPPPKAPHWLEEQLKLALSAPSPAERQAQLQQLLVTHLALCEPALDAFRRALAARQGFAQLPAQIVSAFVKCGCTTTNLDGLEAILYAMFGSPDLRYLRLPKVLDERKLSAAGTIRELAKVLSSSAARAAPPSSH